MVDLEIIRAESRHVTTAQRNNIGNVIELFDQPGSRTGRNAKNASVACGLKCGIRLMIQKEADRKNDLLQRAGAVLPAPQPGMR